MKHINSYDQLNEGGTETYTQAQLEGAIRFAIEKHTNYIEAMSYQETKKCFLEWKEEGMPEMTETKSEFSED